LWSERKLPDWDRAHGRLQVDGAQVAALAHYVPQVLAPEGQWSAKLELKSGRQFDGTLSLTNISTRALGNLAPLRDISARVRFDSQRAVLEDFHGQIGGQPILADGFITLLDPGGLDYRVNLRGTNVPLARSLELLLRSDFDVRLRGGSNLPPVLTGGVNLHDGLYLEHAPAMVWSGPKRTEFRPPYFSVTNEPLANWRMDLAISGNRFLRVRTPVFSGLLSASLKLNGTLLQPVLTGDVRADSGRALFPFGTLSLNQGHASFSGDDPQGPDLQINASGRNYRYEVQLEVKGPANGAEIRFSSTPPLTSEQILLMLTAGEAPQGDFVFSSEARAGRLATFLGKDFLSRFLGSDQAGERLIIRTGESISDEGQLTYSVEYRLTDRWSIIGEYDEFNAFNTDLKWKIFTR
jgi:translocation and assembly module TamB